MLERLIAHNAWANEIYVRWYLGLPEGDEYALKMLSHVLQAEKVWISRINGGDYRDTWGLVPPENLDALRRENSEGWKRVFAADAAEPSRMFQYKRLDGTPCESTVEEVLTHACMHGMHHRGQVAAHAARLGRNIPSTDFILFVRL